MNKVLFLFNDTDGSWKLMEPEGERWQQSWLRWEHGGREALEAALSQTLQLWGIGWNDFLDCADAQHLNEEIDEDDSEIQPDGEEIGAEELGILRAFPLLFVNVQDEGARVYCVSGKTRAVVEPNCLYTTTELSLWTAKKLQNYESKQAAFGKLVSPPSNGDATALIMGNMLHGLVEREYLRGEPHEFPNGNHTRERLSDYFKGDPSARLKFNLEIANEKIAIQDNLSSVNIGLHQDNDQHQCEVPFLALESGYDGRIDVVTYRGDGKRTTDIKSSGQNDGGCAFNQVRLYRNGLSATPNEDIEGLAVAYPVDEHHWVGVSPAQPRSVKCTKNWRDRVHSLSLSAREIAAFPKVGWPQWHNTTSHDTWKRHIASEQKFSETFLFRYCRYIHAMNERAYWLAQHKAFAPYCRSMKLLIKRGVVACPAACDSNCDRKSTRCTLRVSAGNDLTDLEAEKRVILFPAGTDGGNPRVDLDNLDALRIPLYATVKKRMNTGNDIVYELQFTDRNDYRPAPGNHYAIMEQPIYTSFHRITDGIQKIAATGGLVGEGSMDNLRELESSLVGKLLRGNKDPVNETTDNSGDYPNGLHELIQRLGDNSKPDDDKKDAAEAIAGKQVSLVSGPPGTGKTYLIGLVALAYAKAGKKVVISTMTNNAAKNVLAGIKTVWEGMQDGNRFFGRAPERLVLWAGKSEHLRDNNDNGKLKAFDLANVRIEDKPVWEWTDNQTDEFKKGIQILVGTNLSTYGHIVSRNWRNHEKVVIVDEASQLTEGGSLLSLCDGHLPWRVLMVGDPKQISPICPETDGIPIGHDKAVGYSFDCTDTGLNKENGIRNYAESLFERLIRKGWKTHQLRHVRRTGCQNLVDLHSELFYDGELEACGNAGHDGAGTVQWYDVPRKEQDAKRSNAHAERTRQIVEEIRKNHPGESIAVIVPYNAQRANIARELASARIDGIEVKTIDSFQGREADHVIFNNPSNSNSLRNSMRLKKVGGTLVDSKLNVALSRARKGFYFVGDFGELCHDRDMQPKMTVPGWMDGNSSPRVDVKTEFYTELLDRHLLNQRAIEARRAAVEAVGQDRMCTWEQKNRDQLAFIEDLQLRERVASALAVDMGNERIEEAAPEHRLKARAVNYAHIVEDEITRRTLIQYRSILKRTLGNRREVERFEGQGKEPFRLNGSPTIGGTLFIAFFNSANWPENKFPALKPVRRMMLGLREEGSIPWHEEWSSEDNPKAFVKALQLSNHCRIRVSHGKPSNMNEIDLDKALNELKWLCTDPQGLWPRLKNMGF